MPKLTMTSQRMLIIKNNALTMTKDDWQGHVEDSKTI